MYGQTMQPHLKPSHIRHTCGDAFGFEFVTFGDYTGALYSVPPLLLSKSAACF